MTQILNSSTLNRTRIRNSLTLNTTHDANFQPWMYFSMHKHRPPASCLNTEMVYLYYRRPYGKQSIRWASYLIRKLTGCACAKNPATFFPRHRLKKRLLVSDLGMRHGTCVTHVPWCMSGSLTRGGGENVPGILSACTTSNFTYLARGPLLHHCTDQAFLEHFGFSIPQNLTLLRNF